MRRKKIVAIALTLLMIIGTVFSLCSCWYFWAVSTETKNIFETDLFVCYYDKNTQDKTIKGIVILEFTEKGQEQEVIVIPKEINGLPVKGLCGQIMGYTVPYKLKSNKLKKLYVNAEYLGYAKGNPDKNEITNVDIIWNTNENALFLIDTFIAENNFYVASSMLFFENYSMKYNEFKDSIHNGNIRYYIEKDNFYRIDNFSSDNLYVLPEDPSKEGYIFGGWYTDEDFNNKWDKSFPKSQEEELNLYAKWVKA